LDFLTINNMIFIAIGIVLGLIPYFLSGKGSKEAVVFLLNLFLEILDEFDFDDLDKKEILFYLFDKIIRSDFNSDFVEEAIKEVYEDKFVSYF